MGNPYKLNVLESFSGRNHPPFFWTDSLSKDIRIRPPHAPSRTHTTPELTIYACFTPPSYPPAATRCVQRGSIRSNRVVEKPRDGAQREPSRFAPLADAHTHKHTLHLAKNLHRPRIGVATYNNNKKGAGHVAETRKVALSQFASLLNRSFSFRCALLVSHKKAGHRPRATWCM